MTDGGVTVPGPRLPALRSDCGLVDAVVVGSAFCDIVFSGLERLPKLGEEVWADTCSILPGGSYITAAAVHRFGLTAVWMTKFGSDPFSEYVLACARREGLDERAFETLDQSMPNLSISLSFGGGDRSFISYGDTNVSSAAALIRSLRPRIVIRPGLGGIEDFLHAYSLSTKEGLALMVLAEALLRVPDAATADRLIEDKLQFGNWSQHDSRFSAFLVSASAWTLGMTARIIQPGETPDGIVGSLVGAWLFGSVFGIPSAQFAGSPSIAGIFWGVLGALVIIGVLRMVRVLR